MKVRACNATDTDSCTPDCAQNSRQRRDESGANKQKKKLNYVSLDYTLEADFPIQRKRDHIHEMEIEERVIITQGTVTILQRKCQLFFTQHWFSAHKYFCVGVLDDFCRVGALKNSTENSV